MIKRLLKPLSFIPALLLMYMIYSFSGQTGDISSQLSYKASYKIIEAGDYIFDANLDEYQKDHWANKINFITRKLAHMAEYFALAVAVSFPLYVYGLHGFLLMLTAGLICIGFACGDEYHQSFVAGRSPSVKDVCIDGVGVFFGIILVRIIGWTGRKTLFRTKKSKKRSDSFFSHHNNEDHFIEPSVQYVECDAPAYPGSETYFPPQRPYQGGYLQNPPYRNEHVPPQRPYAPGQPQNPPYRDDHVPPQRPYAPGQPQNPPYRNEHVPADKKQKKKEKDWFFDM